MPRINALPIMQETSGSDEIPVVDVSQSTTKKVTINQLSPVGAVSDFAGATAPAGWLLCFGQTLNATANPQYAELFAVIGATYGGTGIASFNLPDLRGRVTAGADAMGGTAANRLTAAGLGVAAIRGAVGGAQTHTLSQTEMPSHTHGSYHKSASPYNTPSPGSGAVTALDGGSYGFNQQGAATGGGQAHNNLQPTLILNKIIKY